MASSLFYHILAFLLFLPQFKATSFSVTRDHDGKLTSLHFSLFQHETVNKTVFTMVDGVGKPGGNSFGSFYAYEDPLKRSANPSSKLMGIAEGTSTTTSADGIRTFTVAKLTLNLDSHKGSISVVGSTYINKPTDHSVVGGTGDFLFVQGIATSFPVKLQPPAFIYRIEFHLYWPPYAV